MEKFRIINPTTSKTYNQLIRENTDTSFFHSSEWANVIQTAYGYRPIYITASVDDKIEGILPLMEINSYLTGKRAVALPFSDHCEPLFKNKGLFKKTLDYLYKIGNERKWKSLEIRGGLEFFGDMVPNSVYIIHTLDLNIDENLLFKKFRSSTKRNIKKAQRSGVTTTISNDASGIKEFYRLNCLTRKKHGLPPQPFSFFMAIHRYIVKEKKGFVVLGNDSGENIAAAVYFNYGDKMLYKYGASDPTRLSSRANNLVMWSAIRTSRKIGVKEFDFGRTAAENQGLIQFKDGWGTTRKNISYFLYDFKKENYVPVKPKTSFNILKEGMKYTPIGLLRIIGKALYRHVG